jgi:hypothetical protein
MFKLFKLFKEIPFQAYPIIGFVITFFIIRNYLLNFVLLISGYISVPISIVMFLSGILLLLFLKLTVKDEAFVNKIETQSTCKIKISSPLWYDLLNISAWILLVFSILFFKYSIKLLQFLLNSGEGKLVFFGFSLLLLGLFTILFFIPFKFLKFSHYIEISTDEILIKGKSVNTFKKSAINEIIFRTEPKKKFFSIFLPADENDDIIIKYIKYPDSNDEIKDFHLSPSNLNLNAFYINNALSEMGYYLLFKISEQKNNKR